MSPRSRSPSGSSYSQRASRSTISTSSRHPRWGSSIDAEPRSNFKPHGAACTHDKDTTVDLKLSEQIALLQATRKAAVERMEKVFAAAEAEKRTFTDQEQKEFDEAKAEIAGLDKQLSNLEELQRVQATKAPPLVPLPDKPHEPIRVVRDLAKGNLHQALEISKRWKDSTPEVETIIKAAIAAGTTTDPAWAHPLAEYTLMASEFVELLRPMTFLGQIAGFRRVPFNIRFPRQTAGSTTGWVGEGISKPVSKLAFDSVTFPWAKVAGIVVITEELARFSNPAAEGLVRADLTAEIAQFMDTYFTSATAAIAGVSPGGILAGIPAATSMPATPTIDDVTNALAACVMAMTAANIPMRNPYWLMHPNTKLQLELMRTPMGVFAFRDEMTQNRLLGIPIVTSANMPVVTAAPAHTFIILIDASEILLADDGPVTIDVSREASLQMDSAPATPPVTMVSLWQQNMLGIKAELYRYWARRRDAAVQWIDQVPLTIPSGALAAAPAGTLSLSGSGSGSGRHAKA